jgi:CheY-like chemotaxis protein
MLHRLIGEDIILNTVLMPEAGYFKADRGQIEQVLMNLVVNARDAMPAGGHVTIATESIELTSSFSGLWGGVTPGPYVRLSVTDTGVGMEAATKAQIFEPFFTTKEVGKGTGLGLSTVYGIIHQTGGAISVASEVGRGTTFSLYFPRVSAVPKANERIPDFKAFLHGSETILLTEDNEMVRNLAAKVLTGHGYKVLSADSGAAALLICKRYDDLIDLLIADVVMPQINGPELVRRLNQTRPEMKVLYMSGHSDKAIAHQKILNELTPFILKPFAPQALIMKVREVLNMDPVSPRD